MVNDSYFRFDDDNKIKYTFSQSWQANWVSWRHTAPYIEWKIIARIVSILDTHSAAYTWQAFYQFNAFRWVCIMMIMRLCNLQTNEHDLQAIMYPIVCKYHGLNINRLNTNNWNKVPVFPRYICNRWQNMVVQPSQTQNNGKIWQQWERWILLRFEPWSPILSTLYAVLSLYTTRFAACTGGIYVSFIEAYLPADIILHLGPVSI